MDRRNEKSDFGTVEFLWKDEKSDFGTVEFFWKYEFGRTQRTVGQDFFH